MKVDIRDYDYGPHPSQKIRLFLPSGRYLTVVVVIHGGYWPNRSDTT